MWMGRSGTSTIPAQLAGQERCGRTNRTPLAIDQCSIFSRRRDDRNPPGTRRDVAFRVPTFELRGAGGVTFWLAIRRSDEATTSESRPLPLSNGASIGPMPLPFLMPGSYRICLDARDVPTGAPVVERRVVAEWSLVITAAERWT